MKKRTKKQKKRGNFEIYKAGYHDSGYLLLLGKNNYKVFKFSINNFCYYEIGDSLFKPSSNKRCTSMLQN